MKNTLKDLMKDRVIMTNDEIVKQVIENIDLFQVKYIDQKKLMAVYRKCSRERASVISTKIYIELDGSTE